MMSIDKMLTLKVSASWMSSRTKSLLILPGSPACLELPVLHGVLEVQATLVGPGLQVYQDLQWVHYVRGRPLFLAATIKVIIFFSKYN